MFGMCLLFIKKRKILLRAKKKFFLLKNEKPISSFPPPSLPSHSFNQPPHHQLVVRVNFSREDNNEKKKGIYLFG